MKKTFTIIIALLFGVGVGLAQTRKAVSILGDSYSTFENYLQPDTNAVWYFRIPKNINDVVSVGQTWWYKFISENGYKLCVNNSFIFGGTNDSWAGAPIGEYKYENWTKEDLYTFRPAMAYMLDHMKYRYPNVEIYFILNCDLKSEINESVKNICNHYSIPYIELTDIDKQSGHPSIKGMQQINEQIKSFIEKAQ